MSCIARVRLVLCLAAPAALFLAASCAGQTPQARKARDLDRLKEALNVKCLVAGDEKPSAPYVNGSLEFKIDLELANGGADTLRFDDDMILIDGAAGPDYVGSYVVHHKTGSSGGSFGDDYFDRAHNYGLANHEEFWPDGSMVGFLDGGTHQMGAPPDYKAPDSLCSKTLAPGAKAKYTTSLRQGVWLKRETSTRLLVVLPEIQVARPAPAPPAAYRMILTMTRAAAAGERSKEQWTVKDKRLVALDADSLKQLLAASQSDLPMRVLALNWLAAANKEAVRPIVLDNIKKAKEGKDLVVAIQLAGYYKLDPGPDGLAAIQTTAKGEKSWSQMAAERYLKDSAKQPAPAAK